VNAGSGEGTMGGSPRVGGIRKGDPAPGENPLESRSIYDGRIVKLSVDRVRFPGGSTGELELIHHAGASAVVPFLDPPGHEDPRIVLVHQYRYAAGGRLWEVPAGMPDSPDEPWEVCARRELAEETGYRARGLHYLTRIFTTPGFTDEVIHLFAATELEPGGVDRDEDEFMEPAVLRFSEVVDKIRTGELVDAKSVSALLFAHAFRRGIGVEERGAPDR
jgi:ADP-ribose pyrophosphatase